jgi:hypothetical protein
MSDPTTVRVYLVTDDVGGQQVLRVSPRRGHEPAPEGGELVAELPDEVAYRMLEQTLRQMAKGKGLLHKGSRP